MIFGHMPGKSATRTFTLAMLIDPSGKFPDMTWRVSLLQVDRGKRISLQSKGSILLLLIPLKGALPTLLFNGFLNAGVFA